MPDKPDPPRLVAIAKDALGVAREALIVVLFLLLILWPAGFNTILVNAGFTKGSVMGFEWEKLKASSEQAKGAGDAITQIQERLEGLEKSLEAAASGPNTEALRAQVRELVQDTRKADQATKSSLIAQQRLIAQAAPAAVETSGWIYAGKTTRDRDRWIGDQSLNDVEVTQLRPGTRVRMDRDVYLRDNDGRDSKNLGRVVAALPRGEEAEVQEVMFHPRSGFVAVWVKVKKA